MPNNKVGKGFFANALFLPLRGIQKSSPFSEENIKVGHLSDREMAFQLWTSPILQAARK